jgi:hypothetical protein
MASGGRTGASEAAASRGLRPGRPGDALGHPLRVALLGLLSRQATLTATEAARELGESSGACSFHLRQLERYGHIEAVPGTRGRVRPWRLAAAQAPDAPGESAGDEFGALARELENEGYRRWLAGRAQAPPGWSDAAFSTIVHLTPAELAELAEQVRVLIAAFAAGREPGRGAGGGARQDAAAGTPDVLPVAVVARMFPLLPAGPSA